MRLTYCDAEDILVIRLSDKPVILQLSFEQIAT